MHQARHSYQRHTAAARHRRRQGWRWLLVGVVALLLGTGLGGWALTLSRRQSRATVAVGCSAMEQLSYHVHAHLTLIVDGTTVPLPANIGITRGCIHWLHTHDTTGLIHVEAPAARTYTVGEFFQVWGQRLDATHLLDRTVDGQHELRAYLNGVRYEGAPQTLTLDPHADVVLVYGPPFPDLPPAFSFPSGS